MGMGEHDEGDAMNPYSYKWLVRIPADCFMAGIHRFKTKKAAAEFIEEWKRTPGNRTVAMSELPTPIKAEQWHRILREGVKP